MLFTIFRTVELLPQYILEYFITPPEKLHTPPFLSPTYIPTPPWQSLIYFLPLICLFWTLHVNRLVVLHINSVYILEIQFINYQIKFYKLYFKLESNVFEFSGTIQRTIKENTERKIVQRYLWEMVVWGRVGLHISVPAYGMHDLGH